MDRDGRGGLARAVTTPQGAAQQQQVGITIPSAGDLFMRRSGGAEEWPVVVPRRCSGARSFHRAAAESDE